MEDKEEQDSGIQSLVVNILHKPRPRYDIYVGRHNSTYNLSESIWHNPFRVSQSVNDNESQSLTSRAQALAKYCRYLRTRPVLLKQVGSLHGKVLACWCAPLPCHAHILAKLAKLMSCKADKEEDMVKKAISVLQEMEQNYLA